MAPPLRIASDLNEQMRDCAEASDWTPIVRLNREFHLAIYSCPPYKLILQELKRLWALADSFIATRLSDLSARLQTVEEHAQLIASLEKRDYALVLATMEAHRASTASTLLWPASIQQHYSVEEPENSAQTSV